jgi:hypothetical protein
LTIIASDATNPDNGLPLLAKDSASMFVPDLPQLANPEKVKFRMI